MTALHVAVFQNDLANILNLLFAGANIEAKAEGGETALHLASQDSKRSGIIGILVRQNANIDSQDDKLQTTLHHAARRGIQNAASNLLQNGADKNSRDDEGMTPLHYAVLEGQGGIVETLTSAFSDIDRKANNGWTALRIAANKGDVPILQTLLRENAKPDAKTVDLKATPLHIAIEATHEMATTVLLDGGANMEAQDRIGRTALQLSVAIGHLGIATLLASRGAILDSRDLESRTAFHQCAMLGHQQIALFLVERGVNINAKDKYNAAPLHYAAMRGRCEMAKMLLSRKVDVRLKDLNGRTALHLAASKGFVDVVKHLIDNDSDSISAVDTKGRTSLHSSARKGHLDVLLLLIGHGADVKVHCKDNMTHCNMHRININTPYSTFYNSSLSKMECRRMTIGKQNWKSYEYVLEASDSKETFYHCSYGSRQHSLLAVKMRPQSASVSSPGVQLRGVAIKNSIPFIILIATWKKISATCGGIYVRQSVRFVSEICKH
jgi:ankyrin repeat protein